MRAAPLVLLLLSLVLPRCAAGDALTREELSKMRVPALKAFLAARGQACEGCAEKDDFVALAFDTQALPTLAPPPAATAAPAPAAAATPGGGGGGADDPDVEALMARFRRERGGGGGGRLEKIKKRLAARGRDVSKLDLSGLAGFESLDDATLETLLEAMTGGAAPPAGGDGEAAARPAAPAAGRHARAPRAAAVDDGEEAAVVDDDGGEL